MLNRAEVVAVIGKLTGVTKIIGLLLYGAGLRLGECLELRVKDLDFDLGQITIRRGKGQKDRVTMLPGAARELLRQHLEVVRAIHVADLAHGVGRVVLPEALARKYPNALLDLLPAFMCTNRRCNVQLRRRRVARGWRSMRGLTRSDTRSRHIFWRTAMTFGRFRSCWAIMM